jgi:hypothetical protein
MATLKTDIKVITDSKLTRRTHPSLVTTGIDLIVLKTIDDLTTEEVRNYNLKIKSINSDQKELRSLEGMDDQTSLDKKKELEENVKKKNTEVDEYFKKLENGEISLKIVESIKNTQSINPENAIRENLQLVGYVGRDINKVTDQSAVRHTQNLLDLKFTNNEVKNVYAKRNLNYFDTLKSDSEVVGPAVPRG